MSMAGRKVQPSRPNLDNSHGPLILVPVHLCEHPPACPLDKHQGLSVCLLGKPTQHQGLQPPLSKVLRRKGRRAWCLSDTDRLKDSHHQAGWRRAGGPVGVAIVMPTRDRDSKGQHGESKDQQAAPWAAWRTIIVSSEGLRPSKGFRALSDRTPSEGRSDLLRLEPAASKRNRRPAVAQALTCPTAQGQCGAQSGRWLS